MAGSLAEGRADVFSDVDLVVVVDDAAFDAVMADRLALIGSWSPLVVGFTGEHVGEPRLIITLTGPRCSTSTLTLDRALNRASSRVNCDRRHSPRIQSSERPIEVAGTHDNEADATEEYLQGRAS